MVAMRKIGVRPELAATGGGSDCNVFNAAGLAAVDLAISMADVHTCDESITIADLEISARLIEAIIEYHDE